MRLDAASIAQVARGAGFVGDDVATATALALASSGGLTHYQHRLGVADCGDWRGLWAVDVDRWADYAAADLYDPHEAARAALELTNRCDGYGWSAVYRAGQHERHYAHAATEATRHLYTQPAVAPFTALTAVDRSHDVADRCRTLQANIARAPTRGR